MRLGQGWIEFHRALGRVADLGGGFFIRNYITVHQKDVCICQPGICLCVSRIFDDRLIELVNGLVKAVPRSLLQVEAALHVELVGLAIFGRVLPETLLPSPVSFSRNWPEMSEAISSWTVAISEAFRRYCSPQICEPLLTSTISVSTLTVSPC